jgi:prepilin-type N-terminal cleavage/methylation domain-containing protein
MIQSRKGFTIVELLIVVVVIAILAAITIVSYNGIQQRAQESSRISMLSTYAKGLNMYASKYSTYPGDTSTACLDGTSGCWSGTNPTNSQAVKTALSEFMTNFPPFPDAAYAYGTQGSFTGYYIAFRINASSCPRIGGTIFLNQTGNGELTCRIGLLNTT